MIDLVQDRLQRYESVRLTPSDIQEHLPTLVELVLEENAQTVIELGVRFGISTNAFLYALGNTGGHLWSVDIDNRFHVDDPAWTFLQGYDLDLGVITQLPELADLILIDTDHRYELTKAEILAYRPKLRSGGLMVFHDTEVMQFDHHAPGSEPPYPVKRAVDEELPAGEFPRTHYTNNHGLTIVKMP